MRKDQRWRQALGLLALIQQTAILPNIPSISAAISACEKGQQWQQALSLLAVMHLTFALPEVIFLFTQAVISACEKGQQWHQALSLSMSHHTAILPNFISLSAAISAGENCQQGQDSSE